MPCSSGKEGVLPNLMGKQMGRGQGEENPAIIATAGGMLFKVPICIGISPVTAVGAPARVSAAAA